jgi:metallo-beta-lactamase class B
MAAIAHFTRGVAVAIAIAGAGGLVGVRPFVHAQTTQQRPEWNQPAAPFRIVANIHYVGTNELAAYLVTTPAGHILIDGGLPESAPLIEQSIRQLGFKVEDVKTLVTTQAHFDHVGSLAALASASGGKVMVMAGDDTVVAQGGKGDYLFGDTATFPPARVDRVLHDGDEVTLGGTTLVAHATPGHTRGCTTWTTNVSEGGRTYSVVFAGSTSVNPGTRFVHNPSYPGIREDYERTFATLGALRPEIFLGAHTGFFDMAGKRTRLESGDTPNPFIDPRGYDAWLTRMLDQFAKLVAAEQATASKN